MNDVHDTTSSVTKAGLLGASWSSVPYLENRNVSAEFEDKPRVLGFRNTVS